jgi:hypothetical protein
VKIGRLHVNWMSYEHQLLIEARVAHTIRTQPEPRNIIAKMARSEVKNYLAQLAEEAEMPFGDPAGFLRAIQFNVTQWGSNVTQWGSSSTNPQPDDDRRDFCNATPKDCTWPVCNRLEHDDDWHESADYNWTGGSPAVLKSGSGALSLKCKMYGDRQHTPCSGTSDEDVPRPCTCACHGQGLLA